MCVNNFTLSFSFSIILSFNCFPSYLVTLLSYLRQEIRLRELHNLLVVALNHSQEHLHVSSAADENYLDRMVFITKRFK